VPPLAWVPVRASLCWIVAYDTLYAMVDREDDLRIGVRSSAILFGATIATRSHCCLAPRSRCSRTWDSRAVSTAGSWRPRGRRGARACASCATGPYERPGGCFRAFLDNNWFGCAVFVGIALDYVFR
jgi:4-hydroxybenzoate polyprenyltransferase